MAEFVVLMLPRDSSVNPCSTRGGWAESKVGSYAFALAAAVHPHPFLLSSHEPAWIALPERLGPEVEALGWRDWWKLGGGCLG